VSAVALLAYVGSVVLAQGGAGSGGTRVATVNLYVVMKNFKKAETFKKELETLDEPFVADLKKLKKSYDEWVKYAQTPGLEQKKKDDAGAVLVGLKRQIEDKKAEEEKVIMKRAEEQIVQIYKDIEIGVQKYAASNGISMVLTYLEPTGSGQEYAPGNIDRKMQRPGSVGACSPIFIGPGVDISEQVIAVLNSSAGG